MKKLSLLLTLLILAVSGNAQQNARYYGIWEGTLNVGVDLRLVFHITDDGHGGLHASADSPDQSAFGLKCDTIYRNGETLNIEMHKLGAKFSGQLLNDTTLSGTFNQRMEVPLTLKKTKKVTARNRPQTPVAPFPYDIYDVSYDNADKSVHFGATLTVPKPEPGINYIKAPEYPVALLITGSGAQDRDETLVGHKPFWVIADYLSRRGIAVLRVDDRGMGKTKGDFMNATSADFANDVEAGIEYLKTRKDIDKNKIGLIGHSEGGMIAPIVASRRTDVNFIILLAGPGIRISELMALQNNAVLESVGISPEVTKQFKPLYKDIVMTIATTKDTSAAYASVLKKVKKWVSKKDSAVLSPLGFTGQNEISGYAHSMVKSISAPWYRYFIQFDPTPYVKKLSCSVLALNGSRDIQVTAPQNPDGLKAALKKSKAKNVSVEVIPGLNHLFQHCKDCTVNEYGSLEETFAPEALQRMAGWLQQVLK